MFDISRSVGQGIRNIQLPPLNMEYGHQAINRSLAGGAIAGLGSLGINALTGRSDGEDDLNLLATISAGAGIGAASGYLGRLLRSQAVSNTPVAPWTGSNSASLPTPIGIEQPVSPIGQAAPNNSWSEVTPPEIQENAIKLGSPSLAAEMEENAIAPFGANTKSAAKTEFGVKSPRKSKVDPVKERSTRKVNEGISTLKTFFGGKGL